MEIVFIFLLYKRLGKDKRGGRMIKKLQPPVKESWSFIKDD